VYTELALELVDDVFPLVDGEEDPPSHSSLSVLCMPRIPLHPPSCSAPTTNPAPTLTIRRFMPRSLKASFDDAADQPSANQRSGLH
jgi:hypothetical protein